MFIEKITLHDVARDPTLVKRYVYLRFSCDECGVIYEKKPGNVSRTKSGLTFCNRKCRGLSTSNKGKGLLKRERDASTREKYGVDSVFQSDIVKARIKESMTEKYGEGVTSALHVPGAKERRRRTHLERYGVEETFQHESFIKKREDTWLKNYGVPYRPFPKNVNELSRRSMEEQPTKWASKAELQFKEMLIEHFGKDNVIHQKWVNGWPIDFYITSIDVYIQFDGIYWHALDTETSVLITSDKPRDKARYVKWVTDRKQDVWFKERSLQLVRITDKQFNSNHDVVKLIEEAIPTI